MSNKRRRALPGRRAAPLGAWLLIGGGAALLAAVLYLVFAPSLAPATIEVTGGPRLKVDREAVDLGDVRLGQTVQAEFTLTNVGDRALVFRAAPWVEVVEGC